MENASDIYFRNFKDATGYIGWTAAGQNYTFGTGYITGTPPQNWVTEIKFTTAKAASSVYIYFRCGATDNTSATYPLRYIRLSAENSAYNNATTATSGDGSFYFQSGAWSYETITLSGSFSAGTHYVYIWNGGSELYGNWSQLRSAEVTVTYDAIESPSAVTASGNTLGSAVSLNVTRYDTSFTHTIAYSFAGQTGTIFTKTSTTTLSWTPPLTLATGIPSATSATCTLTCTTYSGDTQVGDPTTHDFTLNVPTTVKPSASSGWAVHAYVTTVPSEATIAGYVQGYSKARVTFDASKVNMTAAQDATIAHYQIVCGGVTATGADNTVLTLDTQTLTGTTASVIARVYDSRGRYYEETLTVTLNAYSPPVLSGMAVARCTSGGTASESGTYYSALATLTYSAMGALNTCTLKAYIKTVGGTYDAGTNLTSGAASVLGGGLISVAATYITKISAVDTVGNTSSSEFTIPTASVAFNIRDGGTGAAFGKYAETDGEFQLDPDWNIRYHDAVLAMPTNPNLLHNWDFRNPVNQRGASGSVTSGYFFDRWIHYAGTLTINAGYLSFAANASVLQWFEGTGLSGKAVTASVMIGGTVYSATGTYPSNVGGFSVITITGFGSAILGWDAGGLLYFAPVADGTARDVQALKLELGAVSTLAYDAPMDYGKELAVCQRYFLNLGAYSQVFGYTTSSTTAYGSILIPVTMRTSPTISSTGIYLLTHAGGAAGTISYLSAAAQNRIAFGVNATGLPNGMYPFFGYIDSVTDIWLSADL